LKIFVSQEKFNRIYIFYTVIRVTATFYIVYTLFVSTTVQMTKQLEKRAIEVQR